MTTPMDYDIMRSLHKTIENTSSFGATGTTDSWTLVAQALTHTIVVNIPNFTNAVNTVLSITNEDGHEVYASPSMTENGLHILKAEVPLVRSHTVTLTISGVAGGTGGDVGTSFYLQSRGGHE